MLHKFPLKADKKPACLSWKTHISNASELKTAPLVGIMVPKRCIILDLDTYKGVTTEQVDKVLNCKLPWEEAELQETPKGGKHYAFSIDKNLNLTQGSNLLGLDGFDTRCSEKGYIATGDIYKDLTLVGLENTISHSQLMPALPKDAVAALSARMVNESSDFAALVESELKANISDEDVKFYVNKLTKAHSEDSDTWIRVGMALYHQTSGSEAGWDLFDKFSKKCPDKYNLEQNKARWNSFNGSGKSSQIKFGTIIKLAGGVGELAIQIVSDVGSKIAACKTESDIRELFSPIADMNLSTLDESLLINKIKCKLKVITGTSVSVVALKSELNRIRALTFAKSGDFIKKYVFITSTDKFMHIKNKCMQSIRSFDIEHRVAVPFTPDGKTIAASVYASSHDIFVNSSLYAPAFSEIFTYNDIRYVNMYVPPTLAKKPVGTTNIVSRILGHIEHLLADEREREIFTSYLAHNAQFPGKKMHWAILLQGLPGDGKTFFAELMQHVMGFSNVRILNSKDLESGFTGWADDQCITFIEEIKLSNFKKYEIVNSLKPFISNLTVSCTKKGVDPKTVFNTTNYIAFTNFKDAIPLDDTDRRYCVMFSRWQNKPRFSKFCIENPTYYPDLYNDMRDNAGEILTWLHEYSIPDWFMNQKMAPDTIAKSQMVDIERSEESLILEDAIKAFECDDINETTVNITKLQVLASDSHEFRESMPRRGLIKHALDSLGYRYDKRIQVNRKNQTIYTRDEC